ncbi:zinc-binding protein A33-like [Chanos chanos]|uniref:Zinc-binding protein A33-like n=1 Tax=Chanos chanos TaxID=29144 RepID=A0A6J2WA80_CHACN|nr:zinc-binding protein A33-like [Chanos chanos]
MEIQIQTQDTESQIKKEFEKLHQFLREEEAARIAALREEEACKIQTVKRHIEKMNGEITSLSDAIRDLQEMTSLTDIPFLQVKTKYTECYSRAQCTLQDPQMLSGALINVAKHLGNLKFRVWEKMQDIVQYTPVILDPNTAHRKLVLSEDLTSVRYTDTERRLPDNPERYDMYTYVLSSEGFTTGRHSWDVEVEDNTNWSVGVAVESGGRKGENLWDGVWCVWYLDGEYRARSPGGSWTRLASRVKLDKIRVELDCNGGRVSFFGPGHYAHIHTFTQVFTGTIFPLFLNHCEFFPLSILPVEQQRL